MIFKIILLNKKRETWKITLRKENPRICIDCGNIAQLRGELSIKGFKRYRNRCTACIIKFKKSRGYFKYYPKYKNKNLICDKCGFIAKHRCQIDVHHIDGNHLNNNKHNIQFLCSNCHRLHHFG